MKSFLEEGGYTAFTTTFQDLHGMRQLPDLAAQLLMEKGYRFAGEGYWKTASLVHLMKIIAGNEGTFYMENYACFSYKVTTEQLRDFAELTGIEGVVINNDTSPITFTNELRWNEAVYR